MLCEVLDHSGSRAKGQFLFYSLLLNPSLNPLKFTFGNTHMSTELKAGTVFSFLFSNGEMFFGLST